MTPVRQEMRPHVGELTRSWIEGGHWRASTAGCGDPVDGVATLREDDRVLGVPRAAAPGCDLADVLRKPARCRDLLELAVLKIGNELSVRRPERKLRRRSHDARHGPCVIRCEFVDPDLAIAHERDARTVGRDRQVGAAGHAVREGNRLLHALQNGWRRWWIRRPPVPGEVAERSQS